MGFTEQTKTAGAVAEELILQRATFALWDSSKNKVVTESVGLPTNKADTPNAMARALIGVMEGVSNAKFRNLNATIASNDDTTQPPDDPGMEGPGQLFLFSRYADGDPEPHEVKIWVPAAKIDSITALQDAGVAMEGILNANHTGYTFKFKKIPGSNKFGGPGQ